MGKRETRLARSGSSGALPPSEPQGREGGLGVNAKPATNTLLLHRERIYDYRRFHQPSHGPSSPWTIHRQQWPSRQKRKGQTNRCRFQKRRFHQKTLPLNKTVWMNGPRQSS